jgi:hypothetical protein
MNLTDITECVARGIVRNGVAQAIAHSIAGRAISDQPDEWNRILARCEERALSHVYVFVTRFGEYRFTTFVYAPDDIDNSAVIRELLSTDMGAGCLAEGSRPVDEIEAPYNPGANPVDIYDVAGEVNRAVRIISR